jgi:hypothetical protein
LASVEGFDNNGTSGSGASLARPQPITRETTIKTGLTFAWNISPP